MHRFFISPDWIHHDRVELPDELAHQIHQVLRLHPGELITVLDDLGFEYQVKLDLVSSKLASGQIIARQEADGEPGVAITLYQCLTQREKFEWILQKGAELGIYACVPVLSTRSLVRSWSAEDTRKAQRWERVLKEAAEQSHRGRVPRLLPVQKLAPALNDAAEANELCLFPWEEEHGQDLRPTLQALAVPPKTVALFIGPEGGFTPEEADAARQAGIQPVSLGKRILRVETAAMSAVALILYEFGEMG